MVRFKSRYVTFKIVSPEAQSQQELTETLFKSIGSLYGDYGTAVVDQNFRICYFNTYTDIVIIRVNNGMERYIKCALSRIEDENKNGQRHFDVFYVGATLLQCYKSILRYTSNLKVKKYQQINSCRTERKRMTEKLHIT